MKQVIFVSRAIARTWKPAPRSVLISVSDELDGPLSPEPGWEQILRLQFDDKDQAGENVVLFDAAMAQKVLAFVHANEQLDTLVVHCLMGQSRSAAIALFIAELLGVPCFKNNRPVTTTTWTQYNRKVYRVLSDEVHGSIGSAFGERDS